MLGRRFISTGRVLRSQIGSSPIYVGPEVKVSIGPLAARKTIRKGKNMLSIAQLVSVEGPKGTLKLEVPDFVSIKKDESSGKLSVDVVNAENKIQRSMWGTVRSLVNNHVIGVTEGHMAILKFVGTGYGARLENDGKFVNIKVGASIKQGLEVPDGIKVKSPSLTSLIIEGSDKQQVLLFAAKLRDFHPPEPYKGKGIYVNGETIKLKAKKIK
ncbi:Large ribosomal subunit protein uL6m [Nakaseomyces bracarensis]|uniref:Large ribosomal subunit protein uL6m n=1 Tax=Nakaseomyces bracarensis TaxID=273131 RepID=A0ABR4NP50_9SACH